MNLESLKYPVGTYHAPDTITSEMIEAWTAEIASFPQQVRELTGGLGKEQLQWRYRPKGWSIKQVVHHCADSHLNSMVRFKWTLTEDRPLIKAYEEALWAELSDSLDDDLSDTLTLLDGLHGRWIRLLKALDNDQLQRSFIHPQNQQEFSLAVTIGNYAWHCRHHLAHIRQAIAAEGAYN